MSTSRTARFSSATTHARGGVFKCICCGKQTRETGYGEANLEMCAACIREANEENARQDGQAKPDIDFDYERFDAQR